MSSYTYKIYFDFDRDGIGTADDITRYVMDAEWNVGMREAYQLTADESRAMFTLKNDDMRFSPEHVSSPYYGKLVPQRQVRVDAIGTAGTTVMWQGWAETIEPLWGANGAKTARIMAVGAKNLYERAEVRLPLLENVRVDDVLREMLTDVQYPPALGAGWALGVAGNSEIGETTYLQNFGDLYTFGTARVTLSYVGDTWANTNAMQAVADLMAAERGRFFWDRAGKAVFWNRDELPKRVNNDGTLTTFQNMGYVYGDLLANVVTVRIKPRIAEAGTSTLWELDEPVTVRANQSRVVRVRYNNTDTGERVSALNVETPNTGNATLVSDNNVSLSMTQEATGAQITLTTGSTGATVSAIVVRGRRLIQRNEIDKTVEDTQSRGVYGRREYFINAGLLDSESYAQSLAEYELYKRKEPRGRVKSVGLINKGGQWAKQVDWTLGTRIKIEETQTAHSADYFIVGERHTLRDGQKRHETEFYLEPAVTSRFWVLGQAGASEVGQTTLLGV